MIVAGVTELHTVSAWEANEILLMKIYILHYHRRLSEALFSLIPISLQNFTSGLGYEL